MNTTVLVRESEGRTEGPTPTSDISPDFPVVAPDKLVATVGFNLVFDLKFGAYEYEFR